MTSGVILLALVSQTHASTVVPVSHAATVDSGASVRPGSRAAGVSTRPTPGRGRRRAPLVGRDSVSTVADVNRLLMESQDVYVYRRGLDDIARYLCSLCFEKTCIYQF